MRFKLSDSVIQRNLDDFVYLNDMKLHVLTLLSPDMAKTIDFMHEWKSKEDICKFFIDEFQIDEGLAEEYHTDVIQPLVKMGVIVSDSVHENHQLSQHITTAGNVTNSEMTKEENDMLEYMVMNTIFWGVTLELTYSCNLRCPHCYISKQDRKEMTIEDWKSLILQLRRANVANIVFTGGEIFVRKDALEIIEYASSLNFMIDIFTNGTLLTQEVLNKLKDLNIHSVQCSLYYAVPEKHDNFVKMAGAFEKTTQCLRTAKKLGLLTVLKTCLMECNYEEYEGLKDIARELGADFQCTYIIMPSKDGSIKPTEQKIKERLIIRELGQKLKADKKVVDREVYENECLCTAGYSSLSVDSYGDIYMCNAMGIKLGNVKQHDISEIWEHSPELIQWRKITRKSMPDCLVCEYNTSCVYCPGKALKETGSYLQCYEDAKTWAMELHEIN